MERRGWVVAGLVLAASCGGGGGGADGGGEGGGGGDCRLPANVCDTVTLTEVNTSCGGLMATVAMSQNHTDPPEPVATCHYTHGMSEDAADVLVCYEGSIGGATTARATYDADRSTMPVTGETLTDVTGVGERAYFDDNPSIGTHEIQALKGQYLVSVSASSLTAPMATVHTCLMQIATETLALVP